MTGFGRGEITEAGLKVTVELGTVNRKQFDCNVALPRELICLESKLQGLLHARILRGYVKGSVTIAAADSTVSALPLAALKAELAALRAAAPELKLKDDLKLSDLLRFPDVFRSSVAEETDPLTLWPLIEKAAGAALDQLCAMRKREGATLEKDLRQRFAALKAISESIKPIAREVPRHYQEQLKKHLAELLKPADATAVDPELVAHEVALFADHCDISEELTRLDSHFTQTDKAFAEGTGAGRTLDFLCQEFFREINTTGSKANDAEISQRVIAFKAGLEAIREQVQNIE